MNRNLEAYAFLMRVLRNYADAAVTTSYPHHHAFPASGQLTVGIEHWARWREFFDPLFPVRALGQPDLVSDAYKRILYGERRKP